MRHWSFYSLGICLANFEVSQDRIEIAKLIQETADFEPLHELTEEENQSYKKVTNMDFKALLGGLSMYEEHLKDAGEEVILPEGQRYLRDGEIRFAQRDIKFPKNIIYKDGAVRAFTCTSRERIWFLVEDGYEDLTVLKLWNDYDDQYDPDGIVHPIVSREVHMVKTRDGAELSTLVMLPGEVEGKIPAILIRTPYKKENEIPFYERYVHRGYAVVIQDTRGREASTGEWIPSYFETEDGDDTINWIAEQDFCNGRVGMIGGSYLGYVQWAAAASDNPHLAALVSVVCAGSAFRDLPRRGGAALSAGMAWNFGVSKQKTDMSLLVRDDWDELLNVRPITDIPKKGLGYDIPFFNKYMEHPDYDDFWRMGDWFTRSHKKVIPALIMSGWFDDNGNGTTEALELTKDFPTDKKKVILGPWMHSGNANYDIHHVPFGNNALREDIDLQFLRWFDKYLKDIDNGVEKMPTVQYYNLGTNEWRTAENWPLPNTEEVSYYLGSDGDARTSSGNGSLSIEAAGKADSDTYLYDPEDPAYCILDVSENENAVPENYTEQDARKDVLCFDTEPMKEDIAITCDFKVELYVGSDAPDTDFVVRVNDVDENGKSIKMADGVMTARYYQGFDKPSFLEEGKVYKIVIPTTKVSNTFLKGHRMRLTVTSSAKNMLFPNPNTKEGLYGSEIRTANNIVYHSKEYPSRLICRVEK